MKPLNFAALGPYAALLALGLTIHGSCLPGAFYFDDLRLLFENPKLGQLWPPQAWFFDTPGNPAYGRPLAGLTYSLNVTLGGHSPLSLHVGNLILHVVCTLLLFALGTRLLSSKTMGFVLAALWCVHPLNGEVIHYVSARTESLMALCLLACLLCWHKGATQNRPGFLWASVGFCFLGMLAKENMVAAPLLVLAMECCCIQSQPFDVWHKRKGAFFTLWLSLIPLVYLATQYRGAGSETGFGDHQVTALSYFWTQTEIITHYLTLCLWPAPLVLDYNDWPLARQAFDVLGPLVLVLGLLTLTLWGLKKKDARAFWGLLFFGTLAPTSSFYPILSEIASERRMYIPLMGVLALAVPFAFRLAKNQNLWTYVWVAVGLLWSALSFANHKYFVSEVSVWENVVTHRPQNTRARLNLSQAYLSLGQMDKAKPHLMAILKGDSRELGWTEIRSKAHNNLGSILMQKHQWSKAKRHFEAALALTPHSGMAHLNLARTYQKQGLSDQAAHHYLKGLAYEPKNTGALFFLARYTEQNKKLEQALDFYLRLLEVTPKAWQAQLNTGSVYLKMNKKEKARAHFARALWLNPNLPRAREIQKFLLAPSTPTP